MIFFPVKIPQFIKRIFPNYVWDFSSKDKILYLTFDDGPTPEITNWTLNTLKQYNAKATFFCIGNNIEKHSDIFNTIVEQGHHVGNHTHNHLKGWRTSKKNYISNVEQAQEIINTSIIDNKRLPKSNLFRPPFGKIKNSQAKALIKRGYKIIMWSVISIDWDKKLPKEQCLKNVIKHTTNGNIIVFHDSIKAAKNMTYALPEVLEHFSNKGYIFKAIPY
ncbi:polysaccharide deacetylase family protein [Pontimicrobium sp. MEBiC01747]